MPRLSGGPKIKKIVREHQQRVANDAGHGLFFGLLKRERLLLPVAEYVFAPPRRWRFDFAWPPIDGLVPAVALEVEGGVWTRGRHTRGAGYVKDLEKYNEAAVRGWKVIRVTPQQLCTLDTISLIKRALSP